MNQISVNTPYKGRLVVNLRDVTSLVVAIVIFLSIDPFFVWSSFSGGIGVIVFKAIQLFAIVLLLIQINLDRFSKSAFWSAIGILFIFFFYSFFTGVRSGTTHPLMIGNLLIYLFYALNVLTDRSILVKSFEMLRTIFAVILAYTLIIHIFLLLHVPIPYMVLQSGEAGRVEVGQQFYHNYLGCILINASGSLMYRFTSVFTEPGVVGTFCAFFLAANGCEIKKSKKDFIFLISGFLSFSVAFYVMLVIILALKAWRKGGYKLFASLVAIVILYAVLMNVNFSNSMLSSLQERLTITEDGLAGDNRIKEAAEESYQEFLDGDIKTVLLGYGYPDSKETASAWQATASYKESVYCLGVLGYGLIILWFLVTPLICYRSENKEKNRCMYSYMAIFLLSQYQRPYMKGLFLAYILLAGCLYAQLCTDEKKLSRE